MILFKLLTVEIMPKAYTDDKRAAIKSARFLTGTEGGENG